MDSRLLILLYLFFASLLSQAQLRPIVLVNTTQWWRNGATLDFDFTKQRFYFDGVDYTSYSTFAAAASATFVRSSVATYFDASGSLQIATNNTPRFNFDPATGSPKGILFERASTNYFSNSTNLSGWTTLNGTPVVSANVVTAPDGTMTADTFSSNGTFFYTVTNLSAATSGASVNFSVFMKPISGSGGFTLGWGGASQVNGVGDPVAIANIGNGWYRYSIIGRASQNAPNAYPQITVTGGGTYAVWGAQLELSGVATSYIPTSGAQVTRAADSLSLPVASWLNVNAGTMLVTQEYILNAADYNPIIGSSQGDSFGITYQGSSGGNISNFIDGISSGVTGVLASSGLVRTASSYSAAQSRISVRGNTSVSANAKTLTGSTTLYFGRDFNGSPSFIKHVHRFTYFNLEVPAQALSDFSR
jgi:hypothetical protein